MDPVFGSVIMVGTGGTAAELFRDRALAMPPLNESLARKMLESLKSWPLLKGYRGKPGANIDRLTPTDEAKFVIGTREDYEWAREITHRYGLPTRCPVLFSPVTARPKILRQLRSVDQTESRAAGPCCD